MSYKDPEGGKAYYEKNKERINARNRQYKLEHAEEIRLARKKYNSTHREEKKIHDRVYREKIRQRRVEDQEFAEQCREKYRAYYKANAEQICNVERNKNAISRDHATNHSMRWTDEDREYLKTHMDISVSVLAKELGRSIYAIKGQRKLILKCLV